MGDVFARVLSFRGCLFRRARPQVRRSAGPGVDGHDGATRRREGVVRVRVRVRVRVVSLECVHTTRI